ncbi:MAG: hypothetical protein LUI87_04655 [Lachnospiraceae bacterium]|nr:hypothetical protein [Lachnospiraceae bacterium]
MDLLQRMRNLRTDPLILAWAEDSDVMWFPQYFNERIRIPFYAMKKEGDFFLLRMTETSIELSLPHFRLVKMERGDGRESESVTFAIAVSDTLKCRELFLEYYKAMGQYLSHRDDAVLAKLNKSKEEIEGLLRRL